MLQSAVGPGIEAFRILGFYINKKAALSGEGVVSSHSVVATGLVSRHGLEFGTQRAAQFKKTASTKLPGFPGSLVRPIRSSEWLKAARSSSE